MSVPTGRGALPDPSLPVLDWLPTCHYRSFGPNVPDLIVARWPSGLVTREAFRVWICDQPGEVAAVYSHLSRPPEGGTVGLLRLTAQLDGFLPPVSQAPFEPFAQVTLYEPPEEGWPFLLLVSSAGVLNTSERGRYAWQTAETEEEAKAILSTLADQVARRHPPDEPA